jgi:hypothetical protein
MRGEVSKSMRMVETGAREDEEEVSKRRIWRSRDLENPETRKRFWKATMWHCLRALR